MYQTTHRRAAEAKRLRVNKALAREALKRQDDLDAIERVRAAAQRAREERERDEERAWNEAHGFTATCPQCGGAMKSEREVCSWMCWYAQTLKLTD